MSKNTGGISSLVATDKLCALNTWPVSPARSVIQPIDTNVLGHKQHTTSILMLSS